MDEARRVGADGVRPALVGDDVDGVSLVGLVRLLIVVAAVALSIGLIYTFWQYENRFQDFFREDDE